ncbi:glycosyltransferase [Cellulomonas sp. JZ18]|uniref:glycosyltransferase family 2 protein n=1 Tax=Cellulomonas sp. JZ18 TaxID=2654191 RepID=UPI0012D3E218|nr:glycosyltransferase family 2 protein [Cellulomonas sp. JZ18]QGQ18979.1 glycosyltransferase [Cellulomonas sp. JZ18]
MSTTTAPATSASPRTVDGVAVATPVLTVVVPAYNSEAYLDRCLDTVGAAGPEVEVVVVDDGSQDGTAALAQRYADRHPSVRVVRKANGGHGSAINVGLEHARGTYLKVVDSDDWVDEDALAELVATLRGFVSRGDDVDLVVSNFVYEKVGRRPHVVRFGAALPRRRVTTWDGTRRFRKGRYLLMHALVYRTRLLRDCGLRLPEHTFYVDNLYAFLPLQHVRTLYYLDVDLYRYFIGRDDQSVHEAVMLRRLDQQLRVNWAMLRHLRGLEVPDGRLRDYLLHHVEIVCAVSSILLLRSGTPADLAARDHLWDELRAEDAWLYRRVRWSAVGALSNLPGRAGQRASLLAYRVAQRVVGFS